MNQSQSCHLQDVEIWFEDEPAIRHSGPLHRLSDSTPPVRRRCNIHDRLGSPHVALNPSLASSPHSQNRVPLSLRLGERLEDQREVSLTVVENKRRVGRGGSTSRGRGKVRKLTPRIPLLGVGSKKINVLQSQVPSKKKLCLDKPTTSTTRGPQGRTNTTHLPLNEDETPYAQVAVPSHLQRALSSRTSVYFHGPPHPLP